MAGPDWRALAGDKEAWATTPHNDPRYDAFAHEVEDRYKLPRGVLEAIKNAGERTPTEASGKPTVSSAGAKGMMQFIDTTRKVFAHDPSDPFESIDAAGRYMADTLPRYNGNVMAAIADYNGGPRQGRAVIQGQAPPAKETQSYLQRVRTYMDKRYGGEK
jgi:soluble lytic murein transglycosylase-like protein